MLHWVHLALTYFFFFSSLYTFRSLFPSLTLIFFYDTREDSCLGSSALYVRPPNTQLSHAHLSNIVLWREGPSVSDTGIWRLCCAESMCHRSAFSYTNHSRWFTVISAAVSQRRSLNPSFSFANPAGRYKWVRKCGAGFSCASCISAVGVLTEFREGFGMYAENWEAMQSNCAHTQLSSLIASLLAFSDESV